MGYVAQATNKNTGFFMTCTKVDTKEEAIHYAKYYRSIGYNARVYSDEEYTEALEKDSKERNKTYSYE
jgi:hypothetical protein